MVVLLSQDGQLPGLFLLQSLEHSLVIRLGCGLQQVVPEGLILPGLSFTSVLELLLNLKLLRLKKEKKCKNEGTVSCSGVSNRKASRSTYLEALGLLSDLHNMLAPQLPLPPLIVLQLVGELCLVLGPDQLCSCLLDCPQVPELQLLHRLMMPEQHGVLQVLLGLPFVQFLKNEGKNTE